MKKNTNIYIYVFKILLILGLFCKPLISYADELNDNSIITYMNVSYDINKNNSRTTIMPYKKMISDGNNLGAYTTIYTPNLTINKVIELSLTKVGCEYNQNLRESNNIYDCSSFVRRMYQQITGVYIGLNTYEISNNLWKYQVDFNNLEPGDLLWKNGHIAMYLGGPNKNIIHAAGVKYGVIIEGMYSRNIGFTNAFRPINYINDIKNK